MVLCQVYITSANNNNYFVIPYSGKCSIRVLNMQYHDTAGGGQSRAIQLQSDLLFFPYSTMRYLCLLSSANASLNIDQGYKEYNIKDVELKGRIFFNVIDIATGTQPANFQHLLLTLQIEELECK